MTTLLDYINDFGQEVKVIVQRENREEDIQNAIQEAQDECVESIKKLIGIE